MDTDESVEVFVNNEKEEETEEDRNIEMVDNVSDNNIEEHLKENENKGLMESDREKRKSFTNEINILFPQSPNHNKSPLKTISFIFKDDQRFETRLEVPCHSPTSLNQVSMLAIEDDQLSSPRLKKCGSFVCVADFPDTSKFSGTYNKEDDKQWQYSLRDNNNHGTCQMSFQVIMDPDASERTETETFEYKYLLKGKDHEGSVGEWVLVDCTSQEIKSFNKILRAESENGVKLQDEKQCTIM